MGRVREQALKDLAVLRRVCTPRGLYHYNDDDRHGRSPEQLVAECIRRGASFPPDLITAINDAELAVPSKLHRDAFLSLLEFLFKDKEQFAPQNAGVGCRIPKPDPRAYERRCKTAAEKGKPTPKKPAPESRSRRRRASSTSSPAIQTWTTARLAICGSGTTRLSLASKHARARRTTKTTCRSAGGS